MTTSTKYYIIITRNMMSQLPDVYPMVPRHDIHRANEEQIGGFHFQIPKMDG